MNAIGQWSLRVALGVVLAVVVWPRPALAAGNATDDSVRPFGGQRTFGFGPALGFYSGLGGLVSFETEPVGLVVSGGYMPVFVFGNEGAARRLTVDYYGSAQVNTDVLIGPVYEGKKVEIDLLGGYRYNTVLGHGGGLGVRFSIDVSRVLRLEFHWTPNVFPGALGRLRDRGYPANRDPSLPWLQGGLGAAVVVYP